MEIIRNIGHALRILKEFFFWGLAKIAIRIAKLHANYAKSLVKEWGFTTFISAAFTAIMLLPVSLVTMLRTESLPTVAFAMKSWIWIAVGYYVFTILTIAFKLFLMEREELMRQLRDPYDR